MAHLTGNGVPGNNIQAGIGDIYIDRSSKRQYKCVFAYKDSVTGKQICQWEKLEWKNPKGFDPIIEPDTKTEPILAVDKEDPKVAVSNKQQTQNKNKATNK